MLQRVQQVHYLGRHIEIFTDTTWAHPPGSMQATVTYKVKINGQFVTMNGVFGAPPAYITAAKRLIDAEGTTQ